MPATPDGPALIGIDIGTSAIKAVMIGPEGQILDRFAAAHETRRPSQGAVEQDAEGMRTMEVLGRNMAWLLKKLA